jgi:glycosyltransferase involved in cell wall biosynthesis
MDQPRRRAIFTIVSNNYLHYARSLLQSVAAHHPECDRYCIVVDRDLSHAKHFADEFQVVGLEELDLPDPRRFLFRYSILELNTAVKPWAFALLFERQYQQVVYIDPDIRVYDRLDEVFDLLDGPADIVVTPHLLAPITDDKFPTELDIRVAGTYNFGFCALSRSDNTSAFLAWWQSKLVYGCVVDLPRGVFVDQSWIDLVPGMFPNVFVLRHPGYNVAYWNLAQRPVRKIDGRWTAAGQRLVFFHFSGFNAEDPHPFSKHQNRFTFGNMGEEKQLASEYASLLIENGVRTFRALPYGFGTFDDGETPVGDLFRRIYRQDEALQATLGPDPFAHPEILWAPIPLDGNALRPTYAMYAVWKARADVQDAFSLTDGDSVARFFEWFLIEGLPYFSRHVIEKHGEIYAVASSQESVAHIEGVPTRSVRTQFIRQLYFAVLGRDVDPSGLETYERTVSRRLGFLRAYGSVLMSAESRARPEWRVRAGRGARMAIGWMSGVHGTSSATPASINVQESLTPTGWATSDGDIAVHGCWVAPIATLAASVVPETLVRIEGVYCGDYVRKQTGSDGTTMSVTISGIPVGSSKLRGDGPFALEMRLPRAIRAGLANLTITTGAYFVPKTIGLNDDERQLAWIAKRVAIGDQTLFDHERIPALIPIEQVVHVDGVNVIGYIAAESGVGESARSCVKGARTVGLRCKTIDVGYQSLNRQEDQTVNDAVVNDATFKFNLIHVNADQTRRTLDAVPETQREGSINIAYWHWEQPSLPVAYLTSFEGLAEVWVPTAFVHEAVAKIAPVPVFKVPHVVEFPIPAQVSRARLGLPEDKFLVLVMYDFDSYQFRKNPQAAIQAFRTACGDRNDVALVIKTINGKRNPEGVQELRDAVGDLRHVVLLDEYLSRAQVYELQAACDCFLSLHRAEGFGLGLAEMMYLGKPVIGTDWSGNTEFMTSSNSYPVRYELKPLERDLGVYRAGQLWAEADTDHAAAALREILDEPGQRDRIAACAHRDMRRHFSATAIGSAYRRRLALLELRHR